MIGTVIENRFHTNDRIRSPRSCRYRVLQSFFHCREVILRHSAANHFLFEYIRSLQVPGCLETHLYMAILPVSAGLFLILVFHIGFFPDGLTIRNLRISQLDLYLVLI